MGEQYASREKQLYPFFQMFIEHLLCVFHSARHGDPAELREPRYGAKSGDEGDPRVTA